MKEKEIVHQITVPYNLAQNRVSKRMNRTIESMMSQSKIPMEFLGKAVNIAVYLRNRVTTAFKGITSFEALLS